LMEKIRVLRWSAVPPVKLGIGRWYDETLSGTGTMRAAEIRSSVDTIASSMGRRKLISLVPIFMLSAALYTGAQSLPDGTGNKPSEYAAPATCAGCHRTIWETYRLTGMGRSFGRPTIENTLANWTGSYYHAPSGSYFTMLRRGGRFFQRRHQ